MKSDNKLILDKLQWSIIESITTPQDSEIEAYYINSLIKLAEKKTHKKHSSLLDVPCGTGRLDDFFRSYDYDVYGVDLNKRFIKEARKTRKQPENYFVGNMKNFNLNRKFDVILCWFTSFGYLNERENILTLKNFARHLNKKGLLIIDIKNSTVVNREFYNDFKDLKRINETHSEKKNGIIYHMFNSKLYKKNNKNLVFLKKNAVSIRTYNVEEISGLLKRVGISIEHVFELMSFKSVKESSNNFVVIGIKR